MDRAGYEVLNIMTYNVRFDSMPDNITIQASIDAMPKALPLPPSHYYACLSEQPWSTRRFYVANTVLHKNIHVLGLQEVLKRQVYDLQELLGKQWSWVGVGRDDGQEEGEYSAIFYDRRVLQVEDSDTFWLTNTPFDVSRYHNAGSYRIATAAHFSSKFGHVIVINAHLDDQSTTQRALGASLILHRAKYEAIKTRRPVFVTGDFNSPSSDDAYQIITGSKRSLLMNQTFLDRYSWTAKEERGLKNFMLLDLLGATPPQSRSGNYATFTDFVGVNDSTNFERLDYIFAGSNGGWDVEFYRVGENLHDNGIYASDHRPVDSRLKLSKEMTLSVQPEQEL